MKNLVQVFTYGLRCEIEPPAKWTGLHSHDEIECVFFITEQPTRMRIGAENLVLSKYDTLLFWGAIPHQLIAADPHALQYWFTVPTEIFLHWSIPEDLRKNMLNGRVILERNEELRAIDLVSFPLWKKEYDSGSAEWTEPLALSIEARLLRFGAHKQMRASRFQDALGYIEAKDKNSFSPMYDFIVANYKRALTVAEIAKKAGLHENYAISLFKAKCGISMIEFINMLRVYEAQRLLLTQSISIIDIAMEAGFNSVSNFYRCFRKTCGKNPKEYRKNLNPDISPVLSRRRAKTEGLVLKS